jgi:hypothetical protein
LPAREVLLVGERSPQLVAMVELAVIEFPESDRSFVYPPKLIEDGEKNSPSGEVSQA